MGCSLLIDFIGQSLINGFDRHGDHVLLVNQHLVDVVLYDCKAVMRRLGGEVMGICPYVNNNSLDCRDRF